MRRAVDQGEAKVDFNRHSGKPESGSLFGDIITPFRLAADPSAASHSEP